MDPVLTPLTASVLANMIELVTTNIDNPTELNALGTAVEDMRLVHENVAGSDRATFYRLDTSNATVSAPWVMASATAGLRWVAIFGYACNQAVKIANALSVLDATDHTKIITWTLAGLTTGITLTINPTSSTSQTLNYPNITATDTLMTLGLASQTMTGLLIESNTTDSTTTATGAITTAGGIGITKQCTIGGSAAIGGAYDPYARGLTRCLTISGVAANGSAGLEMDAATGNSVEADFGVAGTRYGAMTASAAGFSFSAFSTANFNLSVNGTTWLQIVTTGVSHWFSTTDVSAIGTAGNIFDGGVSIAKRSYLGTIGSTFKGNQIAGVQDGTGANAGQVGEEIKSTVSGVAAAGTTTTGNVTSIALTAGDWLVSGYVVISGGATGLTVNTTAKMSIVTTTGTDGISGDTMVQESVLALLANGLFTISLPAKRMNINTATTTYLTVGVTYAAGSPTIAGTLTASRMR